MNDGATAALEPRTRFSQPANIFSPKLWFVRWRRRSASASKPKQKKSRDGAVRFIVTVKALHNAG